MTRAQKIDTARDPKDARGEEPRYRGGEGTQLEVGGDTLGDARYECVSLGVQDDLTIEEGVSVREDAPGENETREG